MSTVSPPTPSAPRPVPATLLWAVLVVPACVLATAALTLYSPRYGATAAVAALALGLYARSRPAGLAIVWSVWLLAPFARRLFGLEGELLSADPLALLPFLLTAAVGVLELVRAPDLGRRAWTILLLASAGYLIGLPAGAGSPTAALFALFAYGSGLLAFVIGLREPQGGDPRSLRLVLTIALPVIAVYGVLQFTQPLLPWDALWVEQVGTTLNSIGSPEDGRVRIFGTLNSPGTFGLVLGVAAILLIGGRRIGAAKLVGLIAVFAALGLTFVRSAWIALAFALVAMLLVSRGRLAARVFVVLLVAAAALAGLFASGVGGGAVVGRASTLSNPEQDISFNERIATPLRLVPGAAVQPLGGGLGSAGEASRLGGSSPTTLRATDNGPLSLLLQTGPFGFLLVTAAVALSGVAALRNVGRGSADDVLVFGLLVFLGVGNLTGDLFFGVTGAVIWYLLGVAAARERARTHASSDPAGAA